MVEEFDINTNECLCTLDNIFYSLIY